MSSNPPGSAAALPTIERPNGKTYRPRKITGQPVGLDGIEGVIVFGTHDIERAKRLADQIVQRECRPDSEAIKPSRVWWSEKMRYGDRVFEDDPEHGRAGVYFADIGDIPREQDQSA